MRPPHSVILSSVPALSRVAITHSQAIKSALVGDTYVANNIVNGYIKCRDSGVALKVFQEIPHKDTVSWNTMITGYVNSGNFKCAWVFLKFMKKHGILFDGYTFGSILKGVAFYGCLYVGQQVHSDILKMGHEGNVYSGSALLDMYAKCGRVEDASKVFHYMPERNSVSWNALIAAYSEKGSHDICFELLKCMEREGSVLDDGTFAPILTLLDGIEFYKLTMQVHAKVVKVGLDFYNTVFNALITAYSECGCSDDAERVFSSGNHNLDLVSWNSMLAVYVEHDQRMLAFQLFAKMETLGWEPDVYTYTSIISAVSEDAHQILGRSLHALVIKRGLEQLIPISNSLIGMYMEFNDSCIEDVVKIFQCMDFKDLISWNTILTALSQNGLSENALKLFGQMHSEYLEVDHYSFSAALRSCSDLATLKLGQQIHVLALKSGFETNEYVAGALIFMYSKCGIVEDAWKSFEASPRDSSVTWNSIMFAYAQHGQGKVALDLFLLMVERKVKLDHITFVALLTACSHIGLVEEGQNILNSMESDYGIPPRMEHYACAIDLFGRAGRLEEAKKLIKEMPFEPDAMVWKTFLGACRMCGDIELATKVAGHLLELEPREHCTYILLSDVYGYFKNWKEIASLKRLMKDRAVKKVPGWSWIEIKNEVHAFNAEDHSHSHCQQIYQLLRELMNEMKISENHTRCDLSIVDLEPM